jgi:hypothetical protein
MADRSHNESARIVKFDFESDRVQSAILDNDRQTSKRLVGDFNEPLAFGRMTNRSKLHPGLFWEARRFSTLVLHVLKSKRIEWLRSLDGMVVRHR